METRREPEALTDQELLALYLRGDVRAFEEILERYERPLLRYVLRLFASRGGARELAEDIVQEAFLRLVREAGKLGEIVRLEAWLYRVARNLAVDAARKEERMDRRARLAASAETVQGAPSPEERREVDGIVAEKLFGLPANQRDVLILKIQEGKSYREISEITGLSTSNVGYLVHHGLKGLARELQRAGVI